MEMLRGLNYARSLCETLEKLLRGESILDYRVVVEFDMAISVYIVTDDAASVRMDEVDPGSKCSFEFLTPLEAREDIYYLQLSSNLDKMILTPRRSLGNLLGEPIDKKNSPCPVVSFYSYKGGVGRTTAISLFACHLAVHKHLSVFVLDCDFEAPGLINFFGIAEAGANKSGVVEYLKDAEFDDSTRLDSNYVYEVSSSYSGEGKLFIMTAGNLLSSEDRLDYLEGLARVDLPSSSAYVQSLKNLIEDIHREYSPDIVLIDSRTGFNDVYGALVHSISDVAVGLFGVDVQNRPGLYQFLDTFLNANNEIRIVLANSIVYSSFGKQFRKFNELVASYISDEISDSYDSLPSVKTYQFMHSAALNTIGTDLEDFDDFVALVKNRSLEGYVECFDYVYDSLFGAADAAVFVEGNEVIDCTGKQGVEDELVEIQIPNAYSKHPLKNSILEKLENNFPELYAENIDFSEDVQSKFYIRRSMEDVFIDEKFLLLGGKGTGKTAFYLALQDPEFFSILKHKADKKNYKYNVLMASSLFRDNANGGCFSIRNFDRSKIEDNDFFYKRFWTVYIWNVLFKKYSAVCDPVVAPFDIYDDASTAKKFFEYIHDDNVFVEIESNLVNLDDLLQKNNETVLVTFDQLDFMVKPIDWPIAISMLIEYCASLRLKQVLPKLFLRRDLFNKLTNLTNKNQLERRSINIEWSIEELYDFFFKIIFYCAKEEFIFYLKQSHRISDSNVSQISRKIERQRSYNQLNADKHYLRLLVTIFFGKEADPTGGNRYGETYEWFFSNLKNADDTISLRPFLDLMKYALEDLKNDRKSVNQKVPDTNYPALPPVLFSARARERAVDNHFLDLAQEEGNEALRLIFNDIRDGNIPYSLKCTTLLRSQFDKLVSMVIELHPEYNLTASGIEDVLILNGIVSTKYISRGRKSYRFAFLYKYYLGLHGPAKTVRK